MKDDAGFVDQGCLGFEAAPSKCQGSKRDCKRISRFLLRFSGVLRQGHFEKLLLQGRAGSSRHVSAFSFRTEGNGGLVCGASW